MELWQFKISAEKEQAFALFEALEPQCEALTIFEDQKNEALHYVDGICSNEPTAMAIEEAIQATTSTLQPSFQATLQIIKIENQDWLAENCKSLKPLCVGPFFIYGSHIDPAHYIFPDTIAEKPRFNIKIEASTAFGTGHHGTTRGCLNALSHLYQAGFRPHNPFDLGTGTGILAIAMAHLFQVTVLASDVDPEATAKANENAHENDVAALLHCVVSDGLEHPSIQQTKPYDLITANILSGPLIDLAGSIEDALAPGGYLILSGILTEQADAVKAAYNHKHLDCLSMSEDEGWVTLIFLKSSK